jgi:hypothetical protein
MIGPAIGTAIGAERESGVSPHQQSEIVTTWQIYLLDHEIPIRAFRGEHRIPRVESRYYSKPLTHFFQTRSD